MSIWTDLTGVSFCVEFVDAGGVATRALTAGPVGGPPVVFLHGTSGHLEAFSRNIVPHVEAGFRCHAIDMLGHGYTAKPDYPYEIPRYVEHLVAYLDAQGIEAAHFVGESLGGWVAGWLASEQPERRSGRSTRLAGLSNLAVSAMKWTPANTMVPASTAWASRASAKESPTMSATPWKISGVM